MNKHYGVEKKLFPHMTLVAKDSCPNPFWIMLDHVDDINNVQDKLSSPKPVLSDLMDVAMLLVPCETGHLVLMFL